MATAARSALSASTNSDVENVDPFEPVLLRAPFALRCAALSIDYIALVLPPAIWLVVGRLFSDRTASTPLGLGVWIASVAIFVINFLVLPLLRGQSFGKIATGLTIVRHDGEFAGIGRLLLRNSIGYLITVLTGGLGFLIAAFNDSGRALHDVLAGTVVIRGRRL